MSVTVVVDDHWLACCLIMVSQWWVASEGAWAKVLAPVKPGSLTVALRRWLLSAALKCVFRLSHVLSVAALSCHFFRTVEKHPVASMILWPTRACFCVVMVSPADLAKATPYSILWNSISIGSCGV